MTTVQLESINTPRYASAFPNNFISFFSSLFYLTFSLSPDATFILFSNTHPPSDVVDPFTVTMRSFLYSLVLLLPAVAHAANDWSKPCLSGSCSYDVKNTTSPQGSPAGTLHIVGRRFSSYAAISTTSTDWSLRIERLHLRHI